MAYNKGGTDVKGDFATQLVADVDTLPLGGLPVWARADAAYCKEFVEACQERGWDYSVSVTDPRKKAPLLRILQKMKLEEWEWEPLDERGYERAVTVLHRPAGWARFETYVVIRRDMGRGAVAAAAGVHGDPGQPG